MKGNDEITDLFRNRLGNAEMPVRNGFWEELQHDLPQPKAQRQHAVLTPKFYCASAAAAVLLLLGMASATFWYFSPKEEIKEAFTQVAALTPEGSLNGDVVQESFPSIHQADPMAKKPGRVYPSGGTPTPAGGQEDEESVSVSVSFTITQRVYAHQQTSADRRYANTAGQNRYPSAAVDDASATVEDKTSARSANETTKGGVVRSLSSARHWAFEAAIGTSLPKGHYKMPLIAELSVERKLTKKLALEAGLQYAHLPVEGSSNWQALTVPVKLNATLASTDKIDLYAIVGATAGKILNKKNSPVQLSALAGLGIRYKLNDRLALFAEPTVAHHFDSNSEVRSLYSERPTTMNLLCGVRVSY